MFYYLKLYVKQIIRTGRNGINLISLVRNYSGWKRLQKRPTNTFSEELPWMNFDAIRFLGKNLDKEMKVFEYGLGGSTVFLTRRTGKVVSVEHDKGWFNEASKVISGKGITNWTPLLQEPVKGTATQPGDSSDYNLFISSDKNYEGFSFEKYVRSIESFENNYFDWIIIDGRARPACIKHSIQKLKRGGFILVDNAEREHYKRALKDFLSSGYKKVVGGIGPTAFSPDFTETVILKKM